MLDMLRSEVFRLRRRAMPKVLLAALVMTVLAVMALTWGVAQSGQVDAAQRADLLDSLTLRSTPEAAFGFAGIFGALFGIILAASIAATEYGWGTIRALLPRGSSRGAYLVAKLTVLAAFALAVVIVTIATGFLASGVATLLEDLDGGMNDGWVVDLLFGTGRAWLAMLPYMALAFMVANLTKSSAAGISIATAVLFLEGQILMLVAAAGGALERLPELFLSKNAEALLAVNTDDGQADLPGAWQAASVLALYTVAFLAITFWSFKRRDVTVG